MAVSGHTSARPAVFKGLLNRLPGLPFAAQVFALERWRRAGRNHSRHIPHLDGEKYELKETLQAGPPRRTEFTEVGEASEIDVDSDPTVYTSTGDGTSGYMFSEGSGSGEQATLDNRYKREPVEQFRPCSWQNTGQ